MDLTIWHFIFGGNGEAWMLIVVNSLPRGSLIVRLAELRRWSAYPSDSPIRVGECQRPLPQKWVTANSATEIRRTAQHTPHPHPTKLHCMCSDLSYHTLQSLDSPGDLSNLIGFCHSSVVLDVDSWVATPGCPIDSMAAASLSRLSEIPVAYPSEFREPNASWIAPKPSDYLTSVFHAYIIPSNLEPARQEIAANRPIPR